MKKADQPAPVSDDQAAATDQIDMNDPTAGHYKDPEAVAEETQPTE